MPFMTNTLREAARALALDFTIINHRESLMIDIRSRAGELAFASLGEIKPHQVAYIQALRSRLGDYLISQLPSAKAFEAAWADAYNRNSKGN
jgi:hypothetical protein